MCRFSDLWKVARRAAPVVFWYDAEWLSSVLCVSVFVGGVAVHGAHRALVSLSFDHDRHTKRHFAFPSVLFVETISSVWIDASGSPAFYDQSLTFQLDIS